MRRSTSGVPVAFSVGLLLVLAFCTKAFAQQDLELEIESREVTSETFQVRLFVNGLSEAPWLPQAGLGLRWDDKKIRLVEVEKDLSIRGSNVVLFSHKMGNSVAVLLTCGFSCVGPIEPLCSQPILIFTFQVVAEFSVTNIELPAEALPGTETVVTDHRGMPIIPALVNSTVRSRLFIRGDANGDGSVTVSDAVAILLHLFASPRVSCLDIADVDDGGTINIADPVYLLFHLFRNGPAPPRPFSEPGLDPTVDELGCQGAPRCP